MDQLITPSKLEENCQVKVVSLTSLISQDVPHGAILLEYPSSSNKTLRFVNDEHFLVYDFPQPTAFYNEFLKPLRACPVAGDALPLLLNVHLKITLKEHWKTWVPGYVEAVIKPIEDLQEYETIVVIFPNQNIPESKHSVDPHAHYWVLSKRCIPNMGTSFPKHMSIDNYTLPCMIKADYGIGSKGTFKVETEEEMKNVSEEMHKNSAPMKQVVTEFIQDIIGNYCLQFYLFKTGEIHWLGVTNQLIDNIDNKWGGGVVNWGEQTRLKNLLFNTIEPVKNYLHKQGYFGIVGVDILETEDNQYVIDVNPRINGSTPQLILAPVMAALGFTTSVFLTGVRSTSHADDFIHNANQINCDGWVMAIVLSIVDVEDGCEAHVAVFGKTEQASWEAHDRLRTECTINRIN